MHKGADNTRINGHRSVGGGKSTRRKQIDFEQVRSDLLAEILQESSSISLNDASSQLNARQAIESHATLLDRIEELRLLESTLNPELPCRDELSWRRFFDWIDNGVDESEARKSLDKQKSTTKDVEWRLSKRISISRVQESISYIRGEVDDKNQDKTKPINLSNHHYHEREQQQQQNQGSINGSKSNVSSDEYCLVTKVPCNIGDKVFTVDRKFMLTTETAIRDSDLYAFIKNDSIASRMQNVVLVLHLLNEYSKRKRSYWWPYLSILPCKILPALRLTKTKLTNHLSASSHVFEALKMLRAIARQYAYYYKRLQATNLPLKKDFTFLYYSWGVSIVCSRQNEIPRQEQEASSKISCLSTPVTLALIPILDMCNHDQNSNKAIFENDSTFLVASQVLDAGQEVTINYGCRSSGDYYIHNGFVPDVVPFDVVPLTISLNSNNDKLFDVKTKLLKTLNMPTTFGRFKLTMNDHNNRHRRDPHLTMFLIVYFLDEKELDYILASDNPVGIADEIYEYVQYKSNEANDILESSLDSCNGVTGNTNGDKSAEVDAMKRRLAKCLKEYLSRRSSVYIALIDRTLKELEQQDQEDEDGQLDQMDDKLYAIKLLKQERNIYESYVITKDASVNGVK